MKIETLEFYIYVLCGFIKQHLHSQGCVMDQVLEWIFAGEQVHRLLVVGDCSLGGVLSANHA